MEKNWIRAFSSVRTTTSFESNRGGGRFSRGVTTAVELFCRERIGTGATRDFPAFLIDGCAPSATFEV